MMILNKNQKQFLFDAKYVDSKVLDAAIYPGWEQYFINNFTWKVATNPGNRFKTLIIADKQNPEVYYETAINIDMQTLMDRRNWRSYK